MKISFIRHGRLDRTIEPMTVTSFHEWMKGYDLHTINKKSTNTYGNKGSG